MKFAHVELLLLIWIVPLLVLFYLYGWRKRRKILNAFATKRTLVNIIPCAMASRRKIGAVLVLSAAVCAVIALSGPQYGYQWQEIERQGIDIIIALDCSRSMLATDIAPTRLDRAKREIYDLLTMLQGDRVGLVAFSGTAFLQCPLTIDYPAFYLFLEVLTPDYLPVGGSDMAAALENAQQAFDPKSNADKAVILITDGEHTGDGNPMEAAQMAQKKGIKLFTIGVGSSDGVPVPANKGGFKKDAAGQIILSRLDESLLTRMALTTGGSYVRSVAGDMDLEAIYLKQIRSGMDAVTVESGRKQIWADRYQWPLTLAVVLLLLSQWIPPVKRPLVLFLLTAGLLGSHGAAEAGPLQKGYDAYQQQAYDKALKQFIDGQLQDPDNPSVLYNIGNAYYKTGNFDAAKEHYLQALPKAPPELKHSLLYNLGNAAFRQGALQEAVENYKAALGVNPDDRQTKENLAFVQQQLKKEQNRQNQTSQGEPKEQDPSPKDSTQEQNKDEQSKGEPEQQEGDPQKNDSRQPTEHGSESDQDQQAQSSKARQHSAEEKDQDKAPSATSQMLNRLKDQPGKAMMPDYQKRTVEKDW
ncbi:MAG: VWA domain-containing protein [Desulfobacteraceae bacterium]|jgi:Ca-activated chloride channel family protein